MQRDARTSPVCITGMAGFIGFHVARRLKRLGIPLVGLDNFTPYYDPELKQARADILRSEGIECVTLDVADTEALSAFFNTHQPSHVIHLAAQAGCRHCFFAPNEYLHSNIDGFVSLLEVLRKHPATRLIYASSSSVYGCNESIPFKVGDLTEKPANLYGATKKANELMAFAYHHNFGLPCLGLRFFTVYGPWGRPDMAYYSFAEAIHAEKPIRLHNNGDMQRDFTYVDDIVDGIVAALGVPFTCNVVNLGNNRPEELLHLVECLEAQIGKKAIIEFAPMQPGEIMTTYADISCAQSLLGFMPQVSLQEGIARFVAWHSTYTTSKSAAGQKA